MWVLRPKTRLLDRESWPKTKEKLARDVLKDPKRQWRESESFIAPSQPSIQFPEPQLDEFWKFWRNTGSTADFVRSNRKSVKKNRQRINSALGTRLFRQNEIKIDVWWSFSSFPQKWLKIWRKNSSFLYQPTITDVLGCNSVWWRNMFRTALW